jgi:signal transduction histidine kinase
MNSQSRLPSLRRSLSTRLLLLTMAFILLGEVLIYVPSISRFRHVYLEERIAAAHLATFTLDVLEGGRIDEALEAELLDHVGARAITLHEPQASLMLGRLPAVNKVFDLRVATPWTLIADAFDTLWHGGRRTIRVFGLSPQRPDILIDISLDERALWNAMVDYSWRILNLSVVLSVLTALLVYLSLHLSMVLPLRRITESVIAFRASPEDTRTALAGTERRDEIGVVQNELARMQRDLRSALAQKTRLAALGAAVSKINHDLRNLLANAMLLSDSLDSSQDPAVRQTAPRLVAAMERAAKLCSNTLSFARAQSVEPKRIRFAFTPLVEEVAEAFLGPTPGIVRLNNETDGDVMLFADRDQMFRVLMNLGRNAQAAMAETGGLITVKAWRTGEEVMIEVADTGPGIADSAQEHLFEAFAGSARPGGTGLGLAIAREIMRAHGGDIRLERTGPEGTAFHLRLPVG